MNERDVKWEHRLVWLVMIGYLILVGLVLATVSALRADEPHMHGTEPATSWYPELKTERNTSCCSNRDCALTSYCTTSRGGEGIWIYRGADRVCRTLPVDRIVAPPPGVSIDYDEVHACWQRTISPDVATIFCVVGGAGA